MTQFATDRWMNLLLDDGKPDIAMLWELCLRFEYDLGELLDGLRTWLGRPDGQRILDCACGTGFPGIDLARLGYELTCSDGSALMIGYFKRRADLEGVPVTPDLVRWEELTSRYDSPFDVVMCRGCALPYAGTWDDDAPPDRQALTDSVHQFAAILRPGGRLYVDTAEDSGTRGPEVTTHAPFTVGEHQLELTEELNIDRSSRLRFWRSTLTMDGRVYEFDRRSHYLPPDDLMALLREAGLVDVRRADIPGENYAVITARREAG